MSNEEPSERVTIHALAAEDERELLQFELRNRAFFAGAVGDRGDDYFEHFAERHRGLLAENRLGVSMLFVVRDARGQVVGRVNLGSVEQGSAQLGYRIAEAACGRGFARSAVQQALRAAASAGLSTVTAMTTKGNVASQRVLLATGFRAVPQPGPRRAKGNGPGQPFLHYLRTLP